MRQGFAQPRPPGRGLRHAAGWLLMLAAALPANAPAAGDRTAPPLDADNLPPAAELMQRVRAAMPDQPLHLRAQIQSRGEDDAADRSWNADITLAWRAAEPWAAYTLQDAFGVTLEKFTVRWLASGGPLVEYQKGDPPQAAALPDLAAAIPGMDFSWADLSMSFLWWPAGRTLGVEDIKSRPCYIVELPAPAGAAEQLYGSMRLWIDPKVGALLQAEGYDRDGRLLRRMEVKSFKKVNDLFTFQDVLIRSFPSRHKTMLRVRDLELLADPAAPAAVE